MENKNQNSNEKPNDVNKKPDETSGLHVQGHIKIFDPETKEVYIAKRD